MPSLSLSSLSDSHQLIHTGSPPSSIYVRGYKRSSLVGSSRNSSLIAQIFADRRTEMSGTSRAQLCFLLLSVTALRGHARFLDIQVRYSHLLISHTQSLEYCDGFIFDFWCNYCELCVFISVLALTVIVQYNVCIAYYNNVMTMRATFIISFVSICTAKCVCQET